MNRTDQRRIVHSQHDDALVFGAVFAPASDVRFDDVSAVLIVFGGSWVSMYVGTIIFWEERGGEGVSD